MRKNLIVVGNSVAFVIDKPWRKALDIGPETVVHVRCDGQRLILEPVGRRERHQTMSDAQVAELRAPVVMRSLVHEHGMSSEDFARLHHAPGAPGVRGMFRYMGSVTHQMGQVSEVERATMHRMYVCWQQLTQQRSWSDAIELALQQVPMIRDWSSRPHLDGIGVEVKGAAADGVPECAEGLGRPRRERGEEVAVDDDLDGRAAKSQAECRAQRLRLPVRVTGANDDEGLHVNATTRSEVPRTAA